VRNPYIPNQHGAWAMLIIPFLLGTFAAKASIIHILLFIGWLLVYLLSFPFLQFIRTGKSKLYLRPIQVYGALFVVVGAALLILKPVLALIGLAYIPLFLINIYYAKLNQERSFVNDMVAVIQFCSMVYVTYWLGGGTDWILASELFLIVLLYFTGTVFYVKTMIREKKNKSFYVISVIFHIISLVFIGLYTSLLLMIPMLIVLARAVVYPKIKLNIMQIGISEIVFSLILTIFSLGIYS